MKTSTAAECGHLTQLEETMTSPKWLSIGAAAIVVPAVASPWPLIAQAPVVGQAVVITAPDNRAGPRIGIAYLTRGSETEFFSLSGRRQH